MLLPEYVIDLIAWGLVTGLDAGAELGDAVGLVVGEIVMGDADGPGVFTGLRSLRCVIIGLTSRPF